jgi:hypothetical protein
MCVVVDPCCREKCSQLSANLKLSGNSSLIKQAGLFRENMFHARNLARFYMHSIHYVNSATKYSAASTSLWTSLRKFASTPALQEEKPVNEEPKATSKEPLWIRNRNDSAIFKAENKNELFDVIKSKKFTPNNAVFAVNTLSRWIAEGKLGIEEIVSSEELKIIEESIISGNISVNVSQMIQVSI